MRAAALLSSRLRGQHFDGTKVAQDLNRIVHNRLRSIAGVASFPMVQLASTQLVFVPVQIVRHYSDRDVRSATIQWRRPWRFDWCVSYQLIFVFFWRWVGGGRKTLHDNLRRALAIVSP